MSEETWRAPFHPSSETEIEIALEGADPLVATLLKLSEERGTALKIDNATARLDWSSEEGFALFESAGKRELYVFQRDGKGFFIDEKAQQTQFRWLINAPLS